MTDIGTGTWVEVFRCPTPDFPLHSVWLVRRVFNPDLGPCDDCEETPLATDMALELVNQPSGPSGHGPLCACCFRPYHGPEQESLGLARRKIFIPSDPLRLA